MNEHDMSPDSVVRNLRALTALDLQPGVKQEMEIAADLIETLVNTLCAATSRLRDKPSAEPSQIQQPGLATVQALLVVPVV